MSIKLTGNVTFDRSVYQFFDKLPDTYDKERRKVLGRAGAIVRGIARRSLRKRAWRVGSSARGRKSKNSTYTTYWGGTTAISKANGKSPPFSHTSGKTFGLKTILFGYDSKTDQVHVGPIGGSRSTNNIPNVLEFGGQTTNTIPAYAHAKKATLGVRSGRRYKLRKNIAKRPYMKPALDKFIGEYPKLFRDTLV